MKIADELESIFILAGITDGHKIPLTAEEMRANLRTPLLQWAKQIRLAEISQIWGGINKAATIRDSKYGLSNLNLDDLSYYLHNRERVLQGKKAHTPKQWLEDVR